MRISPGELPLVWGTLFFSLFLITIITNTVTPTVASVSSSAPTTIITIKASLPPAQSVESTLSLGAGTLVGMRVKDGNCPGSGACERDTSSLTTVREGVSGVQKLQSNQNKGSKLLKEQWQNNHFYT